MKGQPAFSGDHLHAFRVRCENGHPSRELAEVFLRPDDDDLLAALIAGHGEVKGRELYDAGRVGLSYGRLPNAGRGMAGDRGFPMSRPPGSSTWDRWRLRCPSCPLDVEISGKNMLKLALGLRDAGESCVELPDLASML